MTTKTYKLILLALTFVIVFIVALVMLFNYYDRQALQKASTEDLDNFVVLVFYDENVKFIIASSIDEFSRKHPNYSFLVSKDKEEQLKKKFADSNPQAIAKFEVKRVSDKIQNFHVSFVNDGESSFWYEAHDKEVFPKKIKSYGAGFVFAPCLLGVFIAIIITYLLNFSVEILRKRKQNLIK